MTWLYVFIYVCMYPQLITEKYSIIDIIVSHVNLLFSSTLCLSRGRAVMLEMWFRQRQPAKKDRSGGPGNPNRLPVPKLVPPKPNLWQTAASPSPEIIPSIHPIYLNLTLIKKKKKKKKKKHFISFRFLYTVKKGLRFGLVRISVRLPNYHPRFVNVISLKRFVQFH